MEGKERLYAMEDANIHRTMNKMRGEHSIALMRAEEAGYAKGLRDATLFAAPPVDPAVNHMRPACPDTRAQDNAGCIGVVDTSQDKQGASDLPSVDPRIARCEALLEKWLRGPHDDPLTTWSPGYMRAKKEDAKELAEALRLTDDPKDQT